MIEVESAFARRLVAFAYDLTLYAGSGAEPDARRILCAPFSGVPNVDARALCVAAGERGTVAATVAAGNVALSHESALAARRFVRALEGVRDAYRAQGATATEHVASVALGFGFDTVLDGAERATFEAIEAVARRYDDARRTGEAWNATQFAGELLALAAAVPVRATGPDRTPLPHVERESQANVKRRRSHFSASSLGTYEECGRRWFYRYVCGAVEDRGSPASFYGTAFHWALEHFHREFPRAGDATLEMLERKLDAYLNTAFERYRSGFPTQVEFELQRRRARRTGRRYLTWFLARSRRTPFTVFGTEQLVELDLEGYRFIGYIDRLDRDDASGNVGVVDYKTGTIAQTAEEYRARVGNDDFQLAFYYWARTAAGDRVTRLALVPLKDPTREVVPVELEVVPVSAPPAGGDAPSGTIGIGELERARARMIDLARTLSDEPIEHFYLTADPDVCTFCAYANACRERPLPCEDRFGR
jgi:RecB family exonuclease